MTKNKKYIIPIFIPHLGCNNECVFCNQRKISGSLKPVPKEYVKKIIDEYLEYYKDKKNKSVEVAFFGGSFTGITIEEQIMYLKVVQKYIKEKLVDSIRISTRPDYISQEILNNLQKYNVSTIELGVQSLDEDVLRISKRGHTVKDVEIASKLINDNGFILGHQIMLGLPKSTLEKELETVKKSILMNPKIVRIYPVLVISKTELEKMYLSRMYKPLELDEAVSRAATVTQMYENNNVKVIRTGLHVTEDLASDSSYVAGPIHPAFGQLVRSKIIRDEIEELISKLDTKLGQTIQIEAKLNSINNIVGVKRQNIEYLENKYKIAIKVIVNKNINTDYICKVIK